MTAATPYKRRYFIAGATVLVLAVGGYGLAKFYPALGPIAGTMTPQLYVDSLPGAPLATPGRSLLVDAASARLYMIEDGHVRDSMRVIVGKPASATPALKSTIYYETMNPYWHVPPDLAQKIVAPRVLKDGISYLTERGYEVVTAFAPDATVLPPQSVDWKAVAAGEAQVHIRQRPGPFNSMGQIKFDLPDGHGIYLHDTPHKELFSKDERNLSNGCVRLEDAPRLARWLLGKDPAVGSTPEEHVALPRPVPITISYLDARAQMQLAALN